MRRNAWQAKGKVRTRKRGEASTDWQRLRAMTDDQAERGAADDPVNAPAPADWLAAGSADE